MFIPPLLYTVKRANNSSGAAAAIQERCMSFLMPSLNDNVLGAKYIMLFILLTVFTG